MTALVDHNTALALSLDGTVNSLAKRQAVPGVTVPPQVKSPSPPTEIHLTNSF